MCLFHPCFITDAGIFLFSLPPPVQAIDISEDVKSASAKFTYSVRWTAVTTPYEKRLMRYERFPLNPVHLEVRARGRG